MSYASIVALLKTALLLLTLAQGPNVPPALKTQAVSVANQAITAATQALAAPKTNSPATTVTAAPSPAPAPAPAPSPIPASPPAPTPAPPPSNNFFVSQLSGSDTNEGSLARPFRTITAALSAVRAKHATAADFTISFLNSSYQLSSAIEIDNTLLGSGSSLTLRGANGGTSLTYAGSTLPSNSLAIDDSLLPNASGGTSYAFGGMYGYVDSKQVFNPATGAFSCPAGLTASTFLGQTNVDWPALFCYGTNVNAPLDFGGMYGYVEGKPTVNAITGAANCPTGYTATPFWGATNVDWPATFCHKPHVAGQLAEYEFGGMYGYVDGVSAPNPFTAAVSCPQGFSASQVTGAQNVDWPSWYCYRKASPSLTGHVYVVPVDSEPSGIVIDGAIAPRASYVLGANARSSDDTFTLQMPEIPAKSKNALVAVGSNQWRAFRCSVSALDAGNGLFYTLKLDPTCLNDSKVSPAYSFSHISSVEGSPSFFSQHGQWVYVPSPSPRVAVYLTRPAVITVIPRGHPNFVVVKGTTAQEVQNVHLDNLQFSYGGFQDAYNYVSIQSGITVYAGADSIQNAAVEIENARNVSVTRSRFTHLMGAGLRIGYNASSINVSSDEFSDIAGTGLEAGYWYAPGSEQQAIRALAINDNTITNVGRIFWDSGAIFATYIQDSEIARNTISHVPYSGIAIGWGWTYVPQTGLGNISVHDNHISNIMETLNDGAGVYLNSRMNGTAVYGNVIGPIVNTNTPWINYPLYADDGNGGVTIYDNTINGVDISRLGYITAQNPIFGPNYPILNSPCGYKACDVVQYGNIVH